jgi:hypothetical protein
MPLYLGKRGVLGDLAAALQVCSNGRRSCGLQRIQNPGRWEVAGGGGSPADTEHDTPSFLLLPPESFGRGAHASLPRRITGSASALGHGRASWPHHACGFLIPEVDGIFPFCLQA